MCGFIPSDNAYQPLKLMQTVMAKTNEVCLRYLDNSMLCSLPPPGPAPYITSVWATKNRRRKMEDRHVIIHDLNTMFNVQEATPSSYYAIFDGHAGHDAAAYSAAHLHQFLAESKHFVDNPQQAFIEAFLKTDALFENKCKVERISSGTTAVCALLRPKEESLYIAWVGDSQALLVNHNRYLQCVVPHKPSRTDEKERIENAGGFVIFYGAWRVNGQLAVSRAIGDPDHKPYVSSEPDIRKVPLDGGEDFLILACDGLWDHLNEEVAAAAVYRMVCQNPEIEISSDTDRESDTDYIHSSNSNSGSETSTESHSDISRTGVQYFLKHIKKPQDAKLEASDESDVEKSERRIEHFVKKPIESEAADRVSDELEEGATKRGTEHLNTSPGVPFFCKSNNSLINKNKRVKRRLKHYCKFCDVAVDNFARHLQRQHFDELEVQKFLNLEKKNPLRKHLIDKIRKEGDFCEGVIIPVQEKLQGATCKNNIDLPCVHCKDKTDQISERLVQLSKEGGSTDNISVIVVFLRDPTVIANWYNSNRVAMDTSLDNSNNPFAINSNIGGSDNTIIGQKNDGLLLNLTDRLGQNGGSLSPSGDYFHTAEQVYVKNGNGKRSASQFDYDDDLGPETNVDTIDDAISSPSKILDAIPNNPGQLDFTKLIDKDEIEKATLEIDLHLQKHQSSEFDDLRSPREETPTPPADEVHDGGLDDNAEADSGEDSEDEWNYIKGEEADKENISPSQADREVAEITEESDNMSSQLNPDAAEFVPVSPTRSNPSPACRALINDPVIAQSPKRPQDINISLPNELDFEREVKSRPSDVDSFSNGHEDEDDQNKMTSSQENVPIGTILNGRNIDEIPEFQPGSTPTKAPVASDEFHFGPNAAPFTPSKNLDQSEAGLSTRAIFGDESVATLDTTFDEPAITSTQIAQDSTVEQDSMTASFYKEKTSENLLDLNKIHDLPDDLENFLNKSDSKVVETSRLLDDTISDLPEHDPNAISDLVTLNNDERIQTTDLDKLDEDSEKELASPTSQEDLLSCELTVKPNEDVLLAGETARIPCPDWIEVEFRQQEEMIIHEPPRESPQTECEKPIMISCEFGTRSPIQPEEQLAEADSESLKIPETQDNIQIESPISPAEVLSTEEPKVELHAEVEREFEVNVDEDQGISSPGADSTELDIPLEEGTLLSELENAGSPQVSITPEPIPSRPDVVLSPEPVSSQPDVLSSQPMSPSPKQDSYHEDIHTSSTAAVVPESPIASEDLCRLEAAVDISDPTKQEEEKPVEVAAPASSIVEPVIQDVAKEIFDDFDTDKEVIDYQQSPNLHHQIDEQFIIDHLSPKTNTESLFSGGDTSFFERSPLADLQSPISPEHPLAKCVYPLTPETQEVDIRTDNIIPQLPEEVTVTTDDSTSKDEAVPEQIPSVVSQESPPEVAESEKPTEIEKPVAEVKPEVMTPKIGAAVAAGVATIAAGAATLAAKKAASRPKPPGVAAAKKPPMKTTEKPLIKSAAKMTSAAPPPKTKAATTTPKPTTAAAASKPSAAVSALKPSPKPAPKPRTSLPGTPSAGTKLHSPADVRKPLTNGTEVKKSTASSARTQPTSSSTITSRPAPRPATAPLRTTARPIPATTAAKPKSTITSTIGSTITKTSTITSSSKVTSTTTTGAAAKPTLTKAASSPKPRPTTAPPKPKTSSTGTTRTLVKTASTEKQNKDRANKLTASHSSTATGKTIAGTTTNTARPHVTAAKKPETKTFTARPAPASLKAKPTPPGKTSTKPLTLTSKTTNATAGKKPTEIHSIKAKTTKIEKPVENGVSTIVSQEITVINNAVSELVKDVEVAPIDNKLVEITATD